jgi:hypothetical protein
MPELFDGLFFVSFGFLAVAVFTDFLPWILEAHPLPLKAHVARLQNRTCPNYTDRHQVANGCSRNTAEKHPPRDLRAGVNALLALPLVIQCGEIDRVSAALFGATREGRRIVQFSAVHLEKVSSRIAEI